MTSYLLPVAGYRFQSHMESQSIDPLFRHNGLKMRFYIRLGQLGFEAYRCHMASGYAALFD